VALASNSPLDDGTGEVLSFDEGTPEDRLHAHYFEEPGAYFRALHPARSAAVLEGDVVAVVDRNVYPSRSFL
jgi:hypothetical protein